VKNEIIDEVCDSESEEDFEEEDLFDEEEKKAEKEEHKNILSVREEDLGE